MKSTPGNDLLELLPERIRAELRKEDRRYLRRHSSRLRSTLALVNALQVTSILDVGSGGGIFLLLVPPTWRRMAVDSPSNAKLAKKQGLDSLGLDLEDEDFPLEDNSFELVTLLEVIEHIRNKEHVISEIYRVLKPNGILIVTTPDARNPFWWLRDHMFDAPGVGKMVFKLRTGRLPDSLDLHKGRIGENELTDLISSQRFATVGLGRFKIFRPNDDIVLIARKL